MSRAELLLAQFGCKFLAGAIKRPLPDDATVAGSSNDGILECGRAIAIIVVFVL